MSSITVKDEPIVEKMVQMGRGHLMDVVHKPDLPPRVSVIIPTYNRAQMVCACVDSVLRSDWPDMEVIVADDCSPDDTRRMVEERYRSDARVKYARTERNSLTSGARNQGARCATGDYYFFLDDDNLIEPDYITELLAVFGRHPSAAFVAPLTVHGAEDENRPVWTTGSYYNPWTSQGRDATPPNCRLNSLPEGLEWPTSYSPNAFMTTKVAFELVNGFDEGYVRDAVRRGGFRHTRDEAGGRGLDLIPCPHQSSRLRRVGQEGASAWARHRASEARLHIRAQPHEVRSSPFQVVPGCCRHAGVRPNDGLLLSPSGHTAWCATLRTCVCRRNACWNLRSLPHNRVQVMRLFRFRIIPGGEAVRPLLRLSPTDSTGRRSICRS